MYWFLWENVLMDGPWVNVWDVGNLKILMELTSIPPSPIPRRTGQAACVRMNIVWGVGGTVRDLTLLLLARAPLLPRDLSAWGLGGSCANSFPASGSCSLSGAEGAPHQAREPRGGTLDVFCC